MQTADSFFELLNSQTEILPTINFVVFLGDSPAHDTYDQHPETHMRGLKYISEKLNLTRNHIGDVYPVLGNHEGYPCDQFDANDITLNGGMHQWVIDNATSNWEQWFTNESRHNFRQKAVYSQLHPHTKLRIIGLNPFVMLTTNKYLWGNQTDPMGTVNIVI